MRALHRRRSSIFVTVCAVTFFALLAAPQLSVSRAQDLAGHGLVGTWMVSVSLEGQGPGAPVSPEVTSLVTYFADGNVLVANAGQLPPLPPGSGLFFTEGHGRWVATSDTAATASYVSLALDQAGGLSSTNTTQATVEVDTTGDTISPRGERKKKVRGGGPGLQQGEGGGGKTVRPPRAPRESGAARREE